jgi:hypothetical protein
MKLKIALGVVLSLLVVFTAFAWLSAPRSPNGPPPSPNAFDMLIQAGTQMTPVPMDFDTSQDIDALKAYLDENVDSLALIDQAADQQCMVPESQLVMTDEAYEAVGSIRGVSRLQFVKARVAELEGRSADSADALAKMAVVGKMSSDGGLMVHELVAIAVESQALESLMQLAPNLSEDAKARIKKVIETEIQNEPDVASEIESIMQREHYMAKLQHGTIFGSYLIWQLGDMDNGRENLRKSMLEIREHRESLLQLLVPSK